MSLWHQLRAFPGRGTSSTPLGQLLSTRLRGTGMAPTSLPTSFPTTTCRRGMGGGKRTMLHKSKINKWHKRKLILNYCDQFFGCKPKEHPMVDRTFRPRLWVRLEGLLFHKMFTGWTKIKHFLAAFEQSDGRYVVDTKANILKHKTAIIEKRKRAREAAKQETSNKPQEHPKSIINIHRLQHDDTDTTYKPLSWDELHELGARAHAKIRPNKKRNKRGTLEDDEIFFVRLDPSQLCEGKHIIPEGYVPKYTLVKDKKGNIARKTLANPNNDMVDPNSYKRSIEAKLESLRKMPHLNLSEEVARYNAVAETWKDDGMEEEEVFQEPRSKETNQEIIDDTKAVRRFVAQEKAILAKKPKNEEELSQEPQSEDTKQKIKDDPKAVRRFRRDLPKKTPRYASPTSLRTPL